MFRRRVSLRLHTEVFFFFFKSRIERNVEYDSDFYLLFIHEGKGKNKTSWFNAFGPDDDDGLVRRHVNK